VTRIPVRRALLSVSDKHGLLELAHRLVDADVELVSSGGTAGILSEAGLPVTKVSDVTGAPEILGGRVKTLHPRVHGGILANLSEEHHRRELEEQGIEPFQLVVSNLYPFEKTVAGGDVGEGEAIEEIDIGGPTLVRAAAKNHAWVGIVTSPDQYDEVASAVEAGGLDDVLRRRLAREAFFRTASYDAAIVAWFERTDDGLPERMVLPLERTSELRYGENPHQPGSAFRTVGVPAWWEASEQLQGRAMSFNNYVDADAAWHHVQEYDDPACVIVKHTNACGVATAEDLESAFRLAWEADPLSAFGSVIAVNRPLDAATSGAMAAAGFIEVVVAPSVDDAGALATKSNVRIIAAPPPERPGWDLRRVDGGFVAQAWDSVDADAEWSVVSSRAPSPDEMRDLRFAWQVAAHTKSNAIVIARRGQAVGIGAGDQSRVGASERAVRQAGERAEGAVAASDAFFPFADGIEALAAAGVTAVVEPGGSKGDAEVIAAADQYGVALVFTGRRHFKH
jgi:phosphoribosylaminoimidazolecarboxamide formyltransferase/IMP cyclohydrolase